MANQPRSRPSAPLSVQAAELALAVPQVVAHRMTRLAISGPLPSARDRREFHRMGHEKLSAFSESVQAMVRQTCHAQGQWAAATLPSIWFPWMPQAQGAASAAPARLLGDLAQVLDHGLAPLHRRATANARRLGRTRLK